MPELTRISIVAPCYNEEAVLGTSIPKLIQLLDDFVVHHGCAPSSFAVLVDDGSRDSTWAIISDAVERYPGRIHGIKLSCNAGHQSALLAGLTYVTGCCDAVISIDADLQDDLNALPLMLEEFRAGAEIVLGVKTARDADPLFKKMTAALFYKGMRWLGVDLVENHADCRLMSSKALENLAKFGERVLFLRGLQPLLHGKIKTVSYGISPRLAGESKYPLKKMLALAWNGVTSFSVTPLRVISWLGGGVFFVSFLFSLHAFFSVVQGEALPGWASVTIPLYLLGGAIMLAVGIVGEYVGKIYVEVKGRPRYLIDAVVARDVGGVTENDASLRGGK
ncbi:glycosyltransferase family 2 protein [Uliginosibacterium paludis]|uniref:Glycosyltransferase family 2 protein n=1 Tax=Uliginosibacterium paludis TaxID=1615952 RepID=A0ABV2CMQ3_9RHOO